MCEPCKQTNHSQNDDHFLHKIFLPFSQKVLREKSALNMPEGHQGENRVCYDEIAVKKIFNPFSGICNK
jgi:hypothetical protein